MKVEDELLIRELKKKNVKVFNSIFQEYYSPLVRFSEGILFDPFVAEDEVQQLFINFWENIDRININTSLKGYLFESVRNRCYNRLKSIQVYDKKKILYKEALINSQDLDYEVEENIASKIEDSFQQLPDQQSKIVILKYREGKKYAEIAKILEISINTVKTQLARAKKKIRNHLIRSTKS